MERGEEGTHDANDRELVDAAAHRQRHAEAPSLMRQRRQHVWRASMYAANADDELGESTNEGEQIEQFDVAAEDEKDTTAEQAAAGQDIQGIPWDRLHFSREQYRSQRLASYHNYTNLLQHETCQLCQERLHNTCKALRRDGSFYSFVRNWRSVQSNIMHFQLRNLVWALSPHTVYAVNDNCVNQWSPLTRHTTEVLNLRGPPRGPWLPGVKRVQVSTMCVRNGVVAAGGFTGELVVKVLGREGVAWSGRVCQSEEGITNGIEIFDSERLGFCILTSNNDNAVRLFDAPTMAARMHFPFPWAVNYATLRPNSGVIAAVGDDPDALLVDVNTGLTVMKLTGHLDFSFAVAWHPDGHVLATGNQDCTTRVWDLRYPCAPLAQLPGRMGSIRSLRFSPDGRFLAASEPADFVHVYDVAKGLEQAQEIDLFGEISGISFTPDSQGLFVGVADASYSSMVQYRRTADNRLVPEVGPLAAPCNEWAAMEAGSMRRAGVVEGRDLQQQRRRRRALEQPRQHAGAGAGQWGGFAAQGTSSSDEEYVADGESSSDDEEEDEELQEDEGNAADMNGD